MKQVIAYWPGGDWTIFAAETIADVFETLDWWADPCTASIRVLPRKFVLDVTTRRGHVIIREESREWPRTVGSHPKVNLDYIAARLTQEEWWNLPVSTAIKLAGRRDPLTEEDREGVA